MIRKAKFENFKGLRDVEVTFESRFTVLVGPNGTGKTSVLQGVELVANFDSLTKHSELLPLIADKRPICRVGLSGDSGDGIALSSAPSTHKTTESNELGSRQLFWPVYFWKDGTFTPLEYYETDEFAFGPCLRPKYSSSAIAHPTVTHTAPPVIQASGTGIPSLMAYLKLRDDEVYGRIEDQLRSLLPQIRKIRVDEVTSTDNQGAPKVLLFDTNLDKRIPAEQMSDGTLYILALIVAVLGPHRPKTLLIDDLDMRLHPKAQYELVTLLKKFLDEFPDLQIIATSHSPYILDRLEANDVLVTELADDGSVVIAPLTAHPTYPKWSESMTPGEFWSHTGEGWVKQLKKQAVATP